MGLHLVGALISGYGDGSGDGDGYGSGYGDGSLSTAANLPAVAS
jgi:hypothetical protein